MDQDLPGLLRFDHVIIRAEIALARAVQPIDLAADLGPDDHVIEPQQAGQVLVHAIACGGADQRRFGLDPELAQQGEQDDGLAFAVAEPPAPGFIGGRGDITAVIGPDVEVADLVLH